MGVVGDAVVQDIKLGDMGAGHQGGLYFYIYCNKFRTLLLMGYLSESLSLGITSTKYPVLLGILEITFLLNSKLKLERGRLIPLFRVPNVPPLISL